MFVLFIKDNISMLIKVDYNLKHFETCASCLHLFEYDGSERCATCIKRLNKLVKCIYCGSLKQKNTCCGECDFSKDTRCSYCRKTTYTLFYQNVHKAGKTTKEAVHCVDCVIKHHKSSEHARILYERSIHGKYSYGRTPEL